ncbi:MAG: hypothetical protein A3D67_00640 [Candidatus Lloydbacteria bacterium RIFCSPHIGHO2_02_FULL_51_22]|uniref:Transcription regulator TrmB N-terminal domain-containing protein n=2 Tax=Candidatus Lloydiibacteriota TaxID=1817910 RepID=A0A1G2DG39_9BACT|nr:MAG: hypothetical protein A3D67_00640 [Candidatus Lloydbacteria bacterium RIFCSPHIGHO2_02_FULL_51_22]OGZ15875.1 MAG: hypothetical protein A3J08_04500 [Candidatus Lloydbacteria bacterium RIFCSPLOWO2_02_FULL_51_11]
MAKQIKSDEIDRERLRLLGFTKAEADTFLALLKVDPASVSGVAEASGVPRTTTGVVLRRLGERGLVRKLPDSYRSVWKVKDLRKLESAAGETIAYLKKENAEEVPRAKEIVGEIEAADIGIRVFRGTRQIKRAYEGMLGLSRAERVYFIQGNKPAKWMLAAEEEEYFKKFHKRFKKRGIIMEGIAGEAIFDIFEKISVPFLRSHMNRLLIGRVVPDEYMNFNMDIFIMRDRAFFVGLEQKIVIVVRLAPMVEALRGIYGALAGLGRPIDLNAYLRALIEKRGGK